MNKIKSYKQFITEELMADLPPKAPTEIHAPYQAPVDKYSAEDTYTFDPGDTLHKVTKSKSEMLKMTKYQGWNLDSTQVNTIYDTIIKQHPDTVVTQHTFKFNVDGDNFQTAKYQLSADQISDINLAIDSIVSERGIITDFQIESSTDKEPIQMEYNGKKANEALAQRRADAVSNELIEMGIDQSIITQTIKPEQGPDIYSTTMSKEERDSARMETKDYRYVTINIIYISSNIEILPQITQIIPKEKRIYFLSKPTDTNKHYRFKNSHKKKSTSIKNTKRVKNNKGNNSTKCFFLNDQ